LEHVIGSQSLAATVSHTISLHSLNLLTLGLLVLWALSPLGGQSALRLIHETNATITDTHHVFYADSDATGRLLAGANSVDDFNRVNSVVSTALMTSDTLEWSPVDTWNHPKIPRVEELEQAEDRNATDRPWYALSRNANHSYAALTGVDVINLSKTGATNFTIPYEYMYFGCGLSPANNISTHLIKEYGYNQTEPNTRTQINYLRKLNAAGLLQSLSDFNPYDNQTIAPSSYPSTSSSRDYFFYTKGKADHKPEALLYGSRMVALTYYLFECSMKSVMVEANIICESQSCGVARLRRLNIPRSKRKGDYLPYDVVNNDTYTVSFLQYLGQLGGESGIEGNNPVDAYINGITPWATNVPTKNWTQYVDNPQRSIDMSHRMTRVLNTYWDSSRWPLAMTRNDPWGSASINQTSGEPFQDMTMNRTDATVIRQIPIYRANVGWVASLVICSNVLLLLGISSLLVSLRTTVPDIFDYVSSFTRDNPHINAPHGGSGLNGAERARLLRKLSVQLGDVNANAEVGYISMRSIDGGKDRECGRVRKDRLYR
jgi:hypothetical protein